ncbi:hypothetical protein [Cellvibrio sp.]
MMNYTSKQAQKDAEPIQSVAGTRAAQVFPDQRNSTALQLKQQQIMRSASSHNVIQKLSAEEDELLQGKFSQTVQEIQTENFGGVRCQYSAAANEVEFHIDAGANADGSLMEDYLIALWAARDTLEAGQARAAGHVVMHPGGVQVVKMTMEMLAEALGRGPNLKAARDAKAARKKQGLNPSEGVPNGMENDVLGAPVIAEHLAYRDALVGTQGVSMAPVGGGTMAGDTDMLDEGNDEVRAAYDKAVGAVRHALSLNVRLDLNALKTLITSLESGLKWYQIGKLKVKSWAK